MADAAGPAFRSWSLPPGVRAPRTHTEEAARPGPGGAAAPDPARLELLQPDGAWIRDLLGGLRRAREGLRERSARSIARTLGSVGVRFLEEGSALRRRALELLPATSGLSAAMCAEVLDGMARDWTPDRLTALLEREFGDAEMLDRFLPDGPARQVRVVGAELAFHLASGTVPGVGLTSMLRSLLVKTPVLLKPGRGDVALPVLFHEALLEQDEGLAGAAAVVYWPGGTGAAGEIEGAVLDEVDLVVAYGGNDTVESVRARLAPTKPLVPYRHRLSVGVVGPGGMAEGERAAVAGQVARAVALFDQRGCVSPHVVYLVGNERDADSFAEALAEALGELDRSLPPGRVDEAEASALQQHRGREELRAAAGEVVLRGAEDSAWTVVLDPGGGFQPSCLSRFVRLVPVAGLDDVVERLAPVRSFLQTVGLAGFGRDRLERVAATLAEVGALRVTPFRRLPFPPAWWHHDGRGPLNALVKRVDLEL